MKKILVMLLLCLPVLGFSKSVVEDTQIWVPINTNVKLGEYWRGFLEIQPRFNHGGDHLNNIIARPAIGYALDKHSTVWMGYGLQANATTSDDHDYLIENRIWQGYSYKSTYKDVFIWEVRNRLEERFLPNNSDVSVRWRTRFRGEYLIPTFSAWSIITSEEIFFNLNNNKDLALSTGVNQNRAYIGVGYRFSPTIQVETGYLNQYNWSHSSKADQSNNVWMTNLNLNF